MDWNEFRVYYTIVESTHTHTHTPHILLPLFVDIILITKNVKHALLYFFLLTIFLYFPHTISCFLLQTEPLHLYHHHKVIELYHRHHLHPLHLFQHPKNNIHHPTPTPKTLEPLLHDLE
jgi:hypothetical protein